MVKAGSNGQIFEREEHGSWAFDLSWEFCLWLFVKEQVEKLE